VDPLPVGFWVIQGVDQDVVHVDCEPVFPEFFNEDCVHHCLEGGWGVGEAEEHHPWFEEAFVGDECRLPLVLFLDADVVVSPLYVEL
jgi:hypothetical protein